MRPLFVFLLCLVFDSSLLYVLDTIDNKTLHGNKITYPLKYHLKGELINVFAGLIKPFELWSDYNNVRIDYYGGTTKYYIIGKNDENHKAKYYVFPKTAARKKNKRICIKYDFNERLKINMLLPKIEHYEYSGKEMYYNTEVEVWNLSLHTNNSRVTEKVYLKETLKAKLPVWYEKKIYDILTGQIVIHLTISYYDFKRPKGKDFDIKVNKCKKGMNEEKEYETLEVDDTFLSYRMQHNKSYKEDEYEMRKRIFQDNLRRVVEHNRKNSTYKMAVNHFSDRTDEELAYLSGTVSFDSSQSSLISFPYSDEEVEQLLRKLPKNYDMRTKGYIGYVKDQLLCGSCWAFATTAVVEGAFALRNHGRRLLEFSEQSLIDCSWGFNNHGCRGGNIIETFSYIKKHGIPTESEYGPYLEEEGFCNQNVNKYFRITDYGRVNSISRTKVALHKFGPVAIIIDSKITHNYASGIYYEEYRNNSVTPTHSVVIVGYGVENHNEFWIAKNSWGEKWGESGYIRISVNISEILDYAFYVTFT